MGQYLLPRGRQLHVGRGALLAMVWASKKLNDVLLSAAPPLLDN
jgi:hypothetical protein